MNWLKQLAARFGEASLRPHIVLRVLPEAELRAGFRDAPDSNLWRVTLAELDQFIIECDNRALSQGEKLTNDEMRLAFGGKLALIAFRDKLDEREAEARPNSKLTDAGDWERPN